MCLGLDVLVAMECAERVQGVAKKNNKQVWDPFNTDLIMAPNKMGLQLCFKCEWTNLEKYMEVMYTENWD